MANEKELVISIKGKTSSFDKALEDATSQTKNLQKNLDKITKISAAGFAAVTAAIGGTTLAFSRFQKDFTQVVTLLDKSSFATKNLDQGIKDLQQGVLNLRAASGESFETLNKALFDLISAGIPAEEAIQALTTATNLAAAGGTDVSIAVDAITTSINAFGLAASDSERISQLFFLAQKNGKTTVAELANSLGLAASSANSYGVSLEELLAATAATTLAGKTTSASLTGLNQVFANIAKPTKDAAEEAARLGIQFDTTALRAKGLEGFLNEIVNAEGFTTKSIEKLFGSVEAMGVAFALTGEQNKAFTNTLAQLRDEAALNETFNQALAKSNETVDKVLNKLFGSAQAFLVVLGEKFAPLIIGVADKLISMTKALINADSGTIKIIKNVLLFTAGLTGITAALAITGKTLLFFRNGLVALNTVFPIAAVAARLFWAAVTGPIGIILAGIAGITLAFAGLKKAFADNPEKDLKKITKELDNIKAEEEALQSILETGSIKQKEKAMKRLEDLRREKEELQGIRDELSKSIEQDGITKALEEREKKLEDLKKEHEELTNSILDNDGKISQSEANRLLAIDEEIKKLEELKNAKQEAQAPQAQALQEQEAQAPASNTDEIINEKAREVDLKIEQAKREAEVLKQIRDGAIKEEIEAQREKNRLLAEQDQIKLDNELLNAELRTAGITEQRKQEIEKQLELNSLELANLDEKLALVAEKEQEARGLKAEREEKQREAEAEIKEIELENQVEFNELQREQLIEHLTGQKQTTDQFLLDKINTKKKFDQEDYKNQEKFGKTFSELLKKQRQLEKKFEIQNKLETVDRLAQLRESDNENLRKVGKAAGVIKKVQAIINIGIDTGKGAIAAYASLAGIPLIGPALGAAAAAAIIAFGAEQASKVKSSGAAKGGFVSNGIVGRDTEPFMLSKGEAITPADVTPTLLNMFSQLRDIRANGGFLNFLAQKEIQPKIQTDTIVNEQQQVSRLIEEGEPQRIGIDIGFEDSAIDIIAAKQRENEQLQTGII